MAKKVRIGIVGTGFAGRFHVESMRQVHGVDIQIAGVTSLREESRVAFGAKHGIPVFPDVRSMLGSVDAVDICSPPYAHHEAMEQAAAAGVHIICEKPLTGYFGPEGCGDEYRGDRDSKAAMLDRVVGRLRSLSEIIRRAGVSFGYAENFVYAPAIQKEREIVEKTGAQILRMTGEESHNGSGSPVYGIWRFQGGGSLMGKICHPLSAMLYLKRVEGLARGGKPIRPKTVTARTEQITRLPAYRDMGFIRTEYHDTEDHGWMHVTFEDGTVADAISGEIVLGGIYNYVEIFANNHRTRCNLSPVDILETFNPRGSQFADVYTVEKISTKEGWTSISPDENITLGYIPEMQDFLACISQGKKPQSDFELAADTISAIYAAYLSDERRGAEVAIPLA
ncbi:MAG: Gfo/Idh/MocA family oxidoreductase [Lentisphaerae bacterium]|nr:Gfo/Idh/MocA family oxidoreductase [Lentisphaerota bacterium]